MIKMGICAISKSALPLAALALLAARCGESGGSPDSGADSSTDSVCECTSPDDDHCVGQTAMQCLDGCHFTPDYCAESNDDDGYGWCDSGECFYNSYDTDTDTGAECDCTSQDENYCTLADNAMQCLDGCHFTETECWCADCTSCCTDGECIPSGCDGVSECYSAMDNYCADDITLAECQFFPDPEYNCFEVVGCSDPITCECGSGCSEEGEIAACWCCQTDGGVGDPDAGPDGGV